MDSYSISPIDIKSVKRLMFMILANFILIIVLNVPVFLGLYGFGNVEIFTVWLVAALVVFVSMLLQKLIFPTIVLKKDGITIETWASQIFHWSHLEHFPPQGFKIDDQPGYTPKRSIGSDFSLWNNDHTKKKDFVMLIMPDKLLSEIKKADDLLGTDYFSKSGRTFQFG